MTKAPKGGTTRNAATTTANESPSPRDAKPRKTKRSQLVGMLKAPKGADVAQISRRLCWLPHTTRAALTGLRKAGFTIERITSDGGGSSCYRITAEPATTPAQ